MRGSLRLPGAQRPAACRLPPGAAAVVPSGQAARGGRHGSRTGAFTFSVAYGAQRQHRRSRAAAPCCHGAGRRAAGSADVDHRHEARRHQRGCRAGRAAEGLNRRDPPVRLRRRTVVAARVRAEPGRAGPERVGIRVVQRAHRVAGQPGRHLWLLRAGARKPAADHVKGSVKWRGPGALRRGYGTAAG